jgi:hypothetical protein
MADTTGAEAPPTVLRSRYMHVRALLAIAITAIVGLTVALVIVATSTNSQSTANSVASVNPLPIRFDHSRELGAKLDHSGRRQQRLDHLGSAELGAKLDHSGRLHRLGR